MTDTLLAAPAAVADVPLLYESGREGDFDRVIAAKGSRADAA